MKIAAICMVKNESDIIELFIRHTLNYCDLIFICDHDSADGTLQILEKIQTEIPNRIFIETYYSIKHNQEYIISNLLYKAFDFNADIILPLDCDEFIVDSNDNFNGSNIKNFLNSLDINKVYYLNSYNCSLHNFNNYFLNKNAAYFRNKVCEKYKKIFLGKNIINKYKKIYIQQGNHFVFYYDNTGDKQYINSCLINNIHINHFPIRSYTQFLKKYCIGYINTTLYVGKYTRMAYHWHDMFNNIVNNNGMKIYKSGRSNVKNAFFRKCMTSALLDCLYHEENFKKNFLQLLLQHCECISQKFIEFQIQSDSNNNILFVIQYYGNMDLLEETIDSIKENSYKNFNILILNNSNNSLIFNNYSIINSDKELNLLFNKNEKIIIFMNSGDTLSKNSLSTIITAFITNKIKFLFCHKSLTINDSHYFSRVVDYNKPISNLRNSILLEDFLKNQRVIGLGFYSMIFDFKCFKEIFKDTFSKERFNPIYYLYILLSNNIYKYSTFIGINLYQNIYKDNYNSKDTIKYFKDLDKLIINNDHYNIYSSSAHQASYTNILEHIYNKFIKIIEFVRKRY